MSQVTESIFNGKTHIIPLADVAYVQRFPREERSHPTYPDLEPRIGIHLKHASASPFCQMPSIYLYGDEMEAFISAWLAYRHQLEANRQMELVNEIFGYPHGHRPAPKPSTHTTRDNFEHFLAYTGLARQPQAVQDMLWLAYAHGADSNEADYLLEARSDLQVTDENPDAADAYARLVKAILDDHDYAWSWHCNIAMSVNDALAAAKGHVDYTERHHTSNEAAALAMSRLFGADMRDHPAFPKRAQEPAEVAQPPVGAVSVDPKRCREALREAGKPYPKSNCEACGSLIAPGWKCPRNVPPETKSDDQEQKVQWNQYIPMRD
jgi:hypothetical protein